MDNNQQNKKELSVSQWLLIIFIVFVGIAILINSINKNQEKQATSNVIDLSNYDLVVDIVEFTETYYNNELAGNQNYSNKRIKITGELNNIDIDENPITNNGTTCYLKSNNHYDVACNFKNGDINNLSNYSRGQNITIIGTVDTLRDGFPNKVIYLKQCIVSEE